MWPVIKPSMGTSSTFDLCMTNVRNTDLRQRLNAIKPVIETYSTEYDIRAGATNLDYFDQHLNVGNVTAAEMVTMYNSRLAKKTQPGRAVYDILKSLPNNDRCPFCDHRNVSTLDHILPKTLFPVFAITPFNLVGACSDCNKIKDVHIPNSPENAILHPYYEDISGHQWLHGIVEETSPAAVEFSSLAVAQWPDVLNARILNQFEMLKLGSLYSKQAAREISEIRVNLQRHYNAGGPQAVYDELDYQYQSRLANNLNSWQTATYRALKNCEWFFGGGFANL